MNASITVRLLQVRDPLVEISRDGGQNVTLGLKAYEVRTSSRRMKIQE